MHVDAPPQRKESISNNTGSHERDCAASGYSPTQKEQTWPRGIEPPVDEEQTGSGCAYSCVLHGMVYAISIVVESMDENINPTMTVGSYAPLAS